MNRELVLRIFEGTNARDFAAVLEAMTADVVLTLNGDTLLPTARQAVGREAVGEWFGDWFRMFDRDYRLDVSDVEEHGDRVFLRATHHGRGRVSGVVVVMPSWWVFTVRDGKVARMDSYGSRERASEALASDG